MINRYLILLLGFFSILPLRAWKVDGIEYEISDDALGTVKVVPSQDKYEGVIAIPEKVKYEGRTFTVTAIGESAFAHCGKITKVSLPNSITLIDDYAFDRCVCLTEVIAPNTITRIGKFAFYYCIELRVFTIPSCVTYIGNEAFFHTKLKELNLPNTLTYIGESAFMWNPITTLTIPNSVDEIGGYAFMECLYLNELIFEDGDPEKWIGFGNKVFGEAPIRKVYLGRNFWYQKSSPFSDIKNSFSLTLSNSVTYIIRNAFSGCWLNELTIPSSVNIIESEAFSNCSLRDITITYSKEPIELGENVFGPYSLENLQVDRACKLDNAYKKSQASPFSNIPEIKSLIIGNSISSIDQYAFDNCKGLKELTLSNSITSIGSYAFRNCTHIKEVIIPNSVTQIDAYAFEGCERLKKLTLGHSINSIGEYAFLRCGDINEIIIPPSIKSIGRGALPKTIFLDKIAIPNTINYDSSELHHSTLIITYNPKDCLLEDDGTIFNASKSDLIYVSLNYEGVFNIPESVKTIGENVFKYCHNINQIVALPTDAPTSFDNSCSGLYYQSSLTVPEGSITSYLSTGYWYKFNTIISEGIDCSFSTRGFKYVIDPKVSEAILVGIEDNAKNIEMPSGVKIGDTRYNITAIGHRAFANQTEIESISFGSNIRDIFANAFLGCTSLTSIEFPSTIASIGSSAFEECTNISHLKFPEGPVKIGDKAFFNLPKLESVNTINATAIGKEAFCGTKFDSLEIKAESIGEKSFAECQSLVWVKIDDAQIGDSAFSNCNKLTSFEYSSTKAIGKSAFENCSSLSSLSLNNGLTGIGATAFKSCTALTNIIIPPSVQSIGEGAFENCSNVNQISIGYGITEIGERAFLGENNVGKICITALTPPQASDNSFSKYNIPLYLPENSIDAYDNSGYSWSGFFDYKDPFKLIEITELKIEGIEALADLKHGQSIKLTATILPENATLPYIFWHSTNPKIATVDYDGNVFLMKPEDDTSDDTVQECQIIAETMYADGPIASITIDTSNAGFNFISNDDNSYNYNSYQSGIYNMQGICLMKSASETDIQSLPTGLYIINGKKTLIR